jgi:hypothetical protein
MRPRTVIDGWTQGELALQHAGAGLAPRANGHAPARDKEQQRRQHRQSKVEDHLVSHAFQPVPTPSRGRNAGRIVAAGILGAAGVALASVGAVATVTYSLETTGTLMAVLAGSADATSLMLPASACCLWKTRRRSLAVVAWCMWLAATSITAANVAGYIASHTDVFLAGREVASTERQLVLERVNRLRTERAGIREQRPIGAITVAIQNARQADLEGLRTALAMAKRRDAIDAELSNVAPRLAGLPAVTMTDPSAAVLADILRLPAGEIDLRRIRLAVLLTLPLTAGLLMAMALAIGMRSERAP